MPMLKRSCIFYEKESKSKAVKVCLCGYYLDPGIYYFLACHPRLQFYHSLFLFLSIPPRLEGYRNPAHSFISLTFLLSSTPTASLVVSISKYI